MNYSDRLYYACVENGAAPASVAGWSNEAREKWLAARGKPLPVNPATRALLAFFAQVDRESWKKNLKLSGDAKEDTNALKREIRQLLRSGWVQSKTEERTHDLAHALADFAIGQAEWDVILELF